VTPNLVTKNDELNFEQVQGMVFEQSWQLFNFFGGWGSNNLGLYYYFLQSAQ
jgi:hypothetical protein